MPPPDATHTRASQVSLGRRQSVSGIHEVQVWASCDWKAAAVDMRPRACDRTGTNNGRLRIKDSPKYPVLNFGVQPQRGRILGPNRVTRHKTSWGTHV